MKIGIPRALYYYCYSETWDRFFSELGLEVIHSPETTAGILREGTRQSTADFCLPVKTFLGHVRVLSGSVDFLFIPRYVSVEYDAYMCPKFLGLPDIVRACVQNLPKIIDPMINLKKDGTDGLRGFAREIAGPLSLPLKKVENLISSGTEKEDSKGPATQMPIPPFFRRVRLQAPERENRSLSESKDNTVIGLVGRPYLLFDNTLGMNIFRSLRDLGVTPLYYDPSEDDVKEAMALIPKWVYWSLGREVVTSAHAFFRDKAVDGVINLSSATCGPDSFTGDLIRKRLNPLGKPYMNLSIDEHTSDVGVRTRLEAFADMLRWTPV